VGVYGFYMVSHAHSAMKSSYGYALQYVAVCCCVVQCVAVCCSVLLYGAVFCSVMQCVAACCSVFLCVAVRFWCGNI